MSNSVNLFELTEVAIIS